GFTACPLGDVLASNWAQRVRGSRRFCIETPVSTSNPLRRHGEGRRGGFLFGRLCRDGAWPVCFWRCGRRGKPRLYGDCLVPFILSLPHKRVEHPRRFKANAFIERNSPVVRLRHGQRDEME